MFGDDPNRCSHVYCHGLVAIYLHQEEALYPFFFITLVFEISWTCYDGKDVYYSLPLHVRHNLFIIFD